MKKIRIALAGVGNCASALVQGIEYYRDNPTDVTGLLFPTIAGYSPGDIEVVAAFDVDDRKVGKDLADAIFAEPNCTDFIHAVPKTGVDVHRGPRLDGVPAHLEPFVTTSDAAADDVAAILKESGAQLLLNLLPTGSADATRAYARAALADAKIGFINGIPELIASDPAFAKIAAENKVPLVGDDFKSQIGSTILHRSLIATAVNRGITIDQMYQYNFAGNTDFANLEQRGQSKEVSKKYALEPLLNNEPTWGLAPMFINGQKDTKTGIIRINGRNWGGQPMYFEARLEVNDSANAAGVLVDMIRFAHSGAEQGKTGVLEPVCAYYSKHPPFDIPDEEALATLREWAATS